MPNLPPIILASASPRRAELMQQLHRKFRVVTAPTEEVTPDFLTPAEMAQKNAQRKARAVAARHPRSLVIGADTLVCLGEKVFGKPADFAAAERMLTQLQGRTHQVVTGVCLVVLASGKERLFAATTHVTFHPLSPQQIVRYLKSINPLDKAGAYAIQEYGDRIVAAIDGSYTNVVGLPVEQLRAELERW